MAEDGAITDSAKAIRSISRWIDEGRLRVGEPLPSERELARTLAVGRRPLRWAVNQLDEQGVLRRVSPRVRVVQRVPAAAEGRGGVMESGAFGGASGGAGAGLLSGSIAILAGDQFGMPRTAKSLEGAASGWGLHVILGAMHAIQDARRHVVKLNTAELTEADVAELVRLRIAGVVIPHFRLGAEAWQGMVRRLGAAGLRLVVESDGPAVQAVDRVVPDHEQGAYELTRLLLGRGRRRIVHLAATGSVWWCEARLRGYRRAMQEAGLEPLPPQPVPGSDDQRAKDGDQAVFDRVARHNAGHLVDRLLGPEGADAILCLSDESVSFVNAGCQLCGRVPGRDVLVAGYDNFWREAWGRRFAPLPPVATVDKNNAQVGAALVDVLLQPRTDVPCRRLIPPTLIPSP